MLRQGLYCVFDRKAGCYLAPFTAPNGATAMRALVQRELVSPGAFSQFPDDFFLSELGEWDVRSGRVIPSESLELVGEMRDILKEVKPDA